MHQISKIDWALAQIPVGYEDNSSGFTRVTYVDRSIGSVHMGTGVCYLMPQGSINTHLHSFEESFYILEGEIIGLIDKMAYLFGTGDFGLIPTGVSHGWRNVGKQPVRWLEMQAPQPQLDTPGLDTFFVQGNIPTMAHPTDTEDRGLHLLGHFDESQLPHPGGPSEMEGFNPTTGVAIKMFVDRSFGAIHQSLFLIQYNPGAKIDPHDHTFEKSYLITSGHVRAIADGIVHDLGPGDVIWTGVGCLHSFTNLGTEPVRWLETQAPLPPAKEVFRFEKDWAKYMTKEPA